MNAPHQAHLPVNPHPDPAEGSPLPFAGLTVLVTGEVAGMSRAKAQDAIALLGGKPVTSVSSKTGLVIVGDGAGVSKMNKVRLHQIPVISGDQFAALAADPPSWDGQPVGMSVADLDALTSTDTEAAQAEPRPPRTPGHRVTQTVVYPRIDDAVVQQIRMLCECGHRWLGRTVHDIGKGCPIDTGVVEEKRTDAPWDRRQDEPGKPVAASQDEHRPRTPTGDEGRPLDHATRHSLTHSAWAFA